jgi:hypothetical protein
MHPTCAAFAETGRNHDSIFIAGMAYPALPFRSSPGVEIVYLIVVVFVRIIAFHLYFLAKNEKIRGPATSRFIKQKKWQNGGSEHAMTLELTRTDLRFLFRGAG